MVLSVEEANAFRKFTTYLETNENFKKSLVSSLNENLDLPFFGEATEACIYMHVLNSVIGVLANASDTAYGEDVAHEREQKRLEAKNDDEESK